MVVVSILPYTIVRLIWIIANNLALALGGEEKLTIAVIITYYYLYELKNYRGYLGLINLGTTKIAKDYFYLKVVVMWVSIKNN